MLSLGRLDVSDLLIYTSFCNLTVFHSVVFFRVVRLDINFTYDISRLVGSLNFMSWQYLWSYLDRYQLVVVHAHGDFIIVLPRWEIRLLAS